MANREFREHLQELAHLQQRMERVLNDLQKVRAMVAATTTDLERNAALSRLRTETSWNGS